MRLLHLADLHLGVENYGRLDPATGLNSRLQDFLRCLDVSLDLALSESVDAVLLAGDVYKTPSPNPTWQREFARRVQRLQAANVPLVVIVGNHDTPASYGKATSVDVFHALELPNLHIIRSPKLIQLPTRSSVLQVAGLPWPSRHHLRARDDARHLTQEQTLAKIRQLSIDQIGTLADQVNPGSPAVLVAHVTAAEASLSGGERTAQIGLDPTIPTRSLAHPAFDYVALGHIHRHQSLNPDGSPPVVYSGSLERIDFGEADEEKGFCVIDLDGRGRRGNARWRFVTVPSRPMVNIEVEIPASANPTDTVLERLAAVNVKDAMVRVRYRVTEGQDRVDSRAVMAALEEAHHVVSISAVAVPQQRLSRADISEDAEPLQALDSYLATRDELTPHHDRLRRAAAALDLELSRSESGA
ncbi:MAG: exonuclease SbcCD subunit D [Candidatus Latescibacterota bacterium]|nr:exonuclease SbcCD subunit D [Candidatus Latescibacterota bacterium]